MTEPSTDVAEHPHDPTDQTPDESDLDEPDPGLEQAFPDEPDRLRRLRERLAAAAARDDLVDVTYRIVDTPVGLMLLATTRVGLVRVAYAAEGHESVLQVLADRISPRVLCVPARLETATRQLGEYFEGRRHSFELPLDWRLTTGFRSTVLHHLTEIEYGHTASYTTVASLAGSPRAVRAVGSACATNPLPVVVPCHRVVRSDGGLGGYLGGISALDTKRALLDLEQAAAA